MLLEYTCAHIEKSPRSQWGPNENSVSKQIQISQIWQEVQICLLLVAETEQ